MLTEPLIQQLQHLRLDGMAAALEQQLASPDRSDRSFEDRLALMIQHEITERAGYRLALATWQDGSRAWLDSRGLLHLKSSDPGIPEVTLVLNERVISGWCANGRVWGDFFFTGDVLQTAAGQIHHEVIRPFIMHLR